MGCLGGAQQAAVIDVATAAVRGCCLLSASPEVQLACAKACHLVPHPHAAAASSAPCTMARWWRPRRWRLVEASRCRCGRCGCMLQMMPCLPLDVGRTTVRPPLDISTDPLCHCTALPPCCVQEVFLSEAKHMQALRHPNIVRRGASACKAHTRLLCPVGCEHMGSASVQH